MFATHVDRALRGAAGEPCKVWRSRSSTTLVGGSLAGERETELETSSAAGVLSEPGVVHPASKASVEHSQTIRARCGRTPPTRGRLTARLPWPGVDGTVSIAEPSKESSMQTDRSALFDLEKRIWQSMVDEDTDTALRLLNEPAFMVSPHGAMKFDHAGYRRMAEHGTMMVKSYELSDMEATFPSDEAAILTYNVKQVLCPRGKAQERIEQRMSDTSTWIRADGGWRCVMHTETPVAQSQPTM
jgi:hypothetical protein